MVALCGGDRKASPTTNYNNQIHKKSKPGMAGLTFFMYFLVLNYPHGFINGFGFEYQYVHTGSQFIAAIGMSIPV